MMDLEKQLRDDVDEHMREAFGYEYYKQFPDSFVDAVLDDVKTSSAYEDGYYNDTDIKWALARTVLALCPSSEE